MSGLARVHLAAIPAAAAAPAATIADSWNAATGEPKYATNESAVIGRDRATWLRRTAAGIRAAVTVPGITVRRPARGRRAGSVGNGNHAEARPWFRSRDGPQLGRPGVPAGAWPCKLSAVNSDGGHFRQLPEVSPSPPAAALLLKPLHHHRLPFPFLPLPRLVKPCFKAKQQAFPSPPPSLSVLASASPCEALLQGQAAGLPIDTAFAHPPAGSRPVRGAGT